MKLLLVISIFFCISLNALAMRCEGILKDTNNYEFETGEKEFYFKAELDPNGILILSVNLKNLDTGKRSSYQGSVIYYDMIEYFGVENIQVIRGIWAGKGSNYGAYIEELSKGKSPKEAALHTWSGRQALMHGFLKVESVEEYFLAGHEYEEPYVLVKFVRP